MLAYRFYSLTKSNQRSQGYSFYCKDDASAMVLANAMVANNTRCEVWFEDRLVGIAPETAPTVSDLNIDGEAQAPEASLL